MSASRRMVLSKHHGAGNDFLVLLDPDDRRRLRAAEVAALCHRRTGVGADGLIRATAAPAGADLAMELRNADGSSAEMSGNGIRCLVQAAVDGGLAVAGQVTVATAAGVRTVDYRPGAEPGTGQASVEMGEPRLGDELAAGDLAAAIAAETGSDVADEARWLAAELGTITHMRKVDMGNPHLVLYGDAAIGAHIGRLGSVLAASSGSGANVELAWPGPEPDTLTMVVWERGVGETLACGTGTCAVAAAAHGWGAVGEQVAVRNPGGTLLVTLAGGTATLSGPTRKVATVTVDEDVLAALVASAAPGPSRPAEAP